MKKPNRYSQIIESIFLSHYRTGDETFEFSREEIDQAAQKLSIKLPKNFSDVLYEFRYRADLPEKILMRAPEGKQWIIEPAGKGKYRFKAVAISPQFIPNPHLLEIRIPEATPGIIAKWALTDEQALLAKVRYNSLIDIFTEVKCYSLQNHLRSFVPGLGQVETDEIYVGIGSSGAQYVFPVQAKSGKDKLSVVQVTQDVSLCQAKFPSLICRPIGAQFMEKNLISLFEFREAEQEIRIAVERHYKLVPHEECTEDDLKTYRMLSTSR